MRRLRSSARRLARRADHRLRFRRLVVSWAFERLDLLRVELTTTPDNVVVPKLARRLGFTHEGTLRKRAVERGQRVDILWFGVLREEWVGS
jgi:RimJ/RimL family protein N-acetyltransferase